MARNKSGRSFNPKLGVFVYYSDLLGDEQLNACSRAARNFWDELWMRMAQRETYMMPGDLEVVARYCGEPRKDRARWAVEHGPLLAELEEEGVFSRGEDVDDSIPRDAIVCRRLWRDWVKAHARSVQAKKGGDQASRNRKRRVAAAEAAAAAAEAAATADGVLNGSEGYSDGGSEGVLNDSVQDGGDTGDTGKPEYSEGTEGGSREVPFPTQPYLNPTEPIPILPSGTDKQPITEADPGGSGGEPERIGSVLASLGDISRSAPDVLTWYVSEIVSLTSDDSFRQKPGHVHRIGLILGASGGELLLDGLLTRVRDDQDLRRRTEPGWGSIKFPARFVTSELVKLAQALGVEPPSTDSVDGAN